MPRKSSWIAFKFSIALLKHFLAHCGPKKESTSKGENRRYWEVGYRGRVTQQYAFNVLFQRVIVRKCRRCKSRLRLSAVFKRCGSLHVSKCAAHTFSEEQTMPASTSEVKFVERNLQNKSTLVLERRQAEQPVDCRRRRRRRGMSVCWKLDHIGVAWATVYMGSSSVSGLRGVDGVLNTVIMAAHQNNNSRGLGNTYWSH